MKTETINFNAFLSDDFHVERKSNRKHEIVLASGVVATLLFVGVDHDIVLAAGESSIDAAGDKIYGKLLPIGKWIIIIKGAMDTISSVVQGDFGSARKSFLGYLMVYLVLNGLPWAMDEVDNVFKSI